MFFIGNTVVNSVDDQKSGLETALNNFIINANSQLQKFFPNETLELKFSNALHNVYFRMFPISFGIDIKGINDFGILFDVFEDRLEGCIIWAGGVLPLECTRQLGGISKNKILGWKLRPLTESTSQEHSIDSITLLSPSDFMIPPFLQGVIINEHRKSGKEFQRLSPTKGFNDLSKGEFCWIVRFPLQSEAFFFSRLCKLVGADAVCIGNYLLAIKTDKLITKKEFKVFQTSWSRSGNDANECAEDVKAYDLEVFKQRRDLSEEVGSSLDAFKELDTHLFIRDKNCKSDAIIKSLRKALCSKNRLLRKRAYQFIIRSYGDLKLNISNIWPDFSASTKSVSLSELCNFQPSIMSEIYLWQTILDTRSAILGANVYDISQSSLDASGHLMAARKESVPIVLQASLNALGKSFKGGKAGYLKGSNGSKDLINAVLNAARGLFLDKGILPPLFGIGLDHVDSRNDIPSGRAKSFLIDALETGLVTHIVLDGSSLFDAKGNSKEDFKNAYELVAQYSSYLLQDIDNTLLIDKEICGGELNYIGDSDLANIPKAEEIRIFVDALKSNFRIHKLRSSLCRPMLFIGNVGTTHHAGDISEVKPEITKEWVDEVKNDLFVSAVLHGTTGSHPSILKKSLSGCKKVNIAGDFLHTYLKSLPDQIQEKIKKVNQEEPKKALADVREFILAMGSEQRQYVTDSVFEHSRSLMQTINSPKLSEADLKYFRYVPFIFSDEELNEVMQQVKLAIKSDTNSAHFENFEEISKPEFCPSMIEVQYGSEFDDFAFQFIAQGITNFHIDVGDGKFISREFSGLEKIRRLSQLDSKLNVNVHLMVRDPHLAGENNNQTTFIQAYSSVGCSRIGIHRHSFSSLEQMTDCFVEIRTNGVEPGIVIELDEPLSDVIYELIIEQKIQWVVIMSVPIGYGGQIFDISAVEKIFQLRDFSIKNKLNLDIEIDGGLTLENIRACRKAGANLFSGWSIVKPEPSVSMLEKLTLLQARLLAS
ncbi:class II fructose-bisphosphate aldolase [Alphaproteobacteria bacterium]|nr:class II fructose-bisphosphate aldolase [Alphaproteobacteria bacterium]